MNKIRNESGAMMSVQSDPKTYEMRRDLVPEIKKYRHKYLKKAFIEEIKQLEIK